MKKKNRSEAYKECLLKHMDYRVTFNRIDDSLKSEYLTCIAKEFEEDKQELYTFTLTDRPSDDLAWVNYALENSKELCEKVVYSGRETRTRLDEAKIIYLYGAEKIFLRRIFGR